jgi:hypothetical protein
MKNAPRLAANLDCKADRWFQQFREHLQRVAANMPPERKLGPVCALEARAGFSIIISFRSMAGGGSRDVRNNGPLFNAGRSDALWHRQQPLGHL